MKIRSSVDAARRAVTGLTRRSGAGRANGDGSAAAEQLAAIAKIMEALAAAPGDD